MIYEEAKTLFEEDLKDGKCSDDCNDHPTEKGGAE